MGNDDLTSIQEALAGDSAAFGRLVVKYQDRLFNTMVYLLGSREDAADVVQEAFVKAFLRLETFQGTSAFYTWLYRIAFNVAQDRFRRRRPVRSLDQTRDDFGLEPATTKDRPDLLAEEAERKSIVHEAIGRLDEPFRCVLVLRDLEELSYDEIAGILDISVGTVRSRLHRARHRLRILLQPIL